MGKRFQEIEHTADAAMRVWGRDLAELFANAAHGLAAQLTDDPGKVSLTVERPVELEAYDAETLLVAWLGELLYLSERDGVVFVDFEMDGVTETRLRAVARGGPVREHRRYVKAATFNDLKIVHADEGYETTVVFDV
jgi:SHS2 domain-containing protein